MATANSFLDVTHEIKLDHDNVRDLFERYKTATDISQKSAIANTLVREMAVHGDAEEISVYNHFSSLGLGNAAAHNKEEHAEVKKQVYQADSVKVTDPNYDQVISKAVSTFLEHAEEEENDQFKLILQAVTPEENDKLAKEFLTARGKVPTRPHPWAPQTGGLAQKAAGLQGSLHDKVIETVEGREFVDVKYSHPTF
ncbi:hypothetical protein EIP91_011241 [Steccherinum ochraceum]|uniref:Hemerythrin-like domain-containing protein n=1 Tax=Steccherinum ochraceum TaxID=92696 RepID=A0A4R0RQ26_9APHY|nr:hypothetical protein EIP91_011241 [Steccherinum ochraceum]